MRKAIRITVHLWIEAEDEPAHDFAASTLQMVRDMLAVGGAQQPTLKVTIKKLFEDTSWDAADDA